jgi:G3E family GTPase
VIVANKIDRCTPEAKDQLLALLRHLNTGRFDFERAEQMPVWAKEPAGEHVPETEEYGGRNFVFRGRRFLHPERLWRLIEHGFRGVIRSKGFFRIASRPRTVVEWSLAGGSLTLTPIGFTAPDDLSPEQELVFIGIHMPEEELRAALQGAMLTPEETAAGHVVWARYRDRFPEWPVASR